jgi:hypothetical protein
MTTRSVLVPLALGMASLALVAGCGSSSSGSPGTTTTSAATTMTTPIPGSTYPPATQVTGSTASTATTASNGSGPPTTVPTTGASLVPGQPCTPGSSPDCISPEADGQYVYLIGGAACMAGPLGGPMCSDLDGDGRAGYPDAG